MNADHPDFRGSVLRKSALIRQICVPPRSILRRLPRARTSREVVIPRRRARQETGLDAGPRPAILLILAHVPGTEAPRAVVPTRSLLSPRPGRLGRWLAVCALLVPLAGCLSGIGVRRANTSPLLAAWRASFFEADELSPRTSQTLRRLDLAALYQRKPREAYVRLQQLAVDGPQPDLLFALAEISYHLGRDAERADDCEAVAHYYCCAGYAYHYLFQGTGNREQGTEKKGQQSAVQGREGGMPSLFPVPCSLSPPDDAFDPRFRLACDLYNAGLAKCIRAAQRVGRLDPRHMLHLPTQDGKGFTLSVVHHGFAWRPEEFGPLLFCGDYTVVGLDNHFRTYGLGVPLIGTRVDAAEAAPGRAFYPKEVSFPVTAFFRFRGSLADLGARRSGQLELYNPLAVQSVRVRGRPVPLETDLTTPLAYFLTRTDLASGEWAGFFRADRLRDQAGIYLFEPYQPGKIPVLMVHGLLSSPLTWTPLFNELRADPELRKHYQFWFYRYPTGNPYLLTAADLRLALARLRDDVDPRHQDAAFDQMVFVGHSMGGLVSKLVTQDSGNDFWGLVSREPFEQVKAEPEARTELQRVFFFRQEPCVKRVVFLATPHHGSKLSPSPPARLLSKLVRLSSDLMDAVRDVARENPGLWPGAGGGASAVELPTSIDLLSPASPALETLAGRSAPPGVHYHSVIGVAFGKGAQRTDGIVPYTSAHIDGVDSEVVVPAVHTTVHHHPRAVLEVVRILREHLRAVRAAPPGGVVPAACLGEPVVAPASPR
jgi:pimeloyl-ACP methyl ester carboxylesterase